MKKNKTMKVLAAFVAIIMLLTLSPAVLAEGDNGVIFPITVRQPISTNTVPWATGVSKAFVTTKYSFAKGTTDVFADESGQYSALDFHADNATVDEKDNVNFGISFGQDLAKLSGFNAANAFLVFDFCPYKTKLENLTNLYIGSMYQLDGEWVKRPAVNLAKTTLAPDTWSHLEFSLKELGVTPGVAFEGIYFLFNDVYIPPTTGKSWDHLARAFDIAIVNSVGKNDKSLIPAVDDAEVILTNPLAFTTGQAFPTKEGVVNFNSGSTAANGALSGTGNFPVAISSKAATEGQELFYNLPLASGMTFAQKVGGAIEDYSLVVTIQKGVSATKLIKNLEIGIGNANGTSGYSSLPTVVKTVPIPILGYETANNSGAYWTLDPIKITDILANGTETEFPVAGKTMNTLTASNANLFVFKAEAGSAYTNNWGNVARFVEIKLIAPAFKLEDATVAGGDISWAAPDSAPLCYSVFKADGTKLCDTTDTTVANTKFGTYSVYAYYGNGNYSGELVIEQPEPTPASITYESGNVIFNFGGEATSASVAIISEYSDNTYTELESVSVLPISGATANVLTVPMTSMENKRAFILKDFDTLIPLTAAYPAE